MNIEKLKQLNFKSCLDIGANVGQFYNLIKTVDPTIYIESIEPNPLAAGKFKKQFKDAILHKVGASSTETILPFYINKHKKFSKSASFVKEFQNTDTVAMEIPVRPVDNIVNKSFDLIKIDTEGYEFDVLKGAVKTISTAKYIIIEMGENEELISWLRNKNFYAVDVLHSNLHYEKILLDVLFEKNSSSKEIKMEDFYSNIPHRLEEH